MNETKVPKIVRHLVDKARLTSAVDTCIGEVFLAQLVKVLRLHSGKNTWVARNVAALLTPLKIEDDSRYVGEFHGSLDMRMRGQDLLKQRRSRARQPDDEDRVVTAESHTRAGGKKLARAHRGLQLRVALDGFDTEPAFRFL